MIGALSSFDRVARDRLATDTGLAALVSVIPEAQSVTITYEVVVVSTETLQTAAHILVPGARHTHLVRCRITCNRIAVLNARARDARRVCRQRTHRVERA